MIFYLFVCQVYSIHAQLPLKHKYTIQEIDAYNLVNVIHIPIYKTHTQQPQENNHSIH